MAFTQLLSVGYPQALVQNQVYALPNKKVTIATTADVNVSNDIAFGTSNSIAATNGSQISAFAFLKTAATNAIVTLKGDD